jgi:hypothetical protein
MLLLKPWKAPHKANARNTTTAIAAKDEKVSVSHAISSGGIELVICSVFIPKSFLIYFIF